MSTTTFAAQEASQGLSETAATGSDVWLLVICLIAALLFAGWCVTTLITRMGD